MENLYKDAASIAQVGETGHIKGSLYSYEEAQEYMKDSGWYLPRQEEDYHPLLEYLTPDDSHTGVTDGYVFFPTPCRCLCIVRAVVKAREEIPVDST